MRIVGSQLLFVSVQLVAVEPGGGPQRSIGPGDMLSDGSIVANARIIGNLENEGLFVSDGGDVALFVEPEQDGSPLGWALVTIDAEGDLTVRLRRDDPAPESDGATFDEVRRIVDFDDEGTLVVEVDLDAGLSEPAQYRLPADGSIQQLVYLRGLRNGGLVDPSGSRAAVVDSINVPDTLYVDRVPEPAIVACGFAAVAALALRAARKPPPA